MRSQKTALWIINLFILAVILVITGTLYLTFASAEIRIPSEREEFTATATIRATNDGRDETVPVSFIVKNVSGVRAVPIGDVERTSSKAGGYLTIRNESPRAQALVATTRFLSSDDKLFRLSESTTVPANGSVIAFVEADQDGADNLIGPSRFTIPGLAASLQTVIYGESAASMVFERRTPRAVTQDDINKAEAELTESLVNQVLAEVNQGRETTLTKDLATVKRESIAVLPESGTESDLMTLSLSITVTVLDVPLQTVHEQATKALTNELPDPELLIETIPDSLAVTIASIDTEAGAADISVELTAWIRSDKAVEGIDTRQLTGKTIGEAHEYLLKNGIQGASIELSPSWMPTLPFLERKISLTLQ